IPNSGKSVEHDRLAEGPLASPSGRSEGVPMGRERTRSRSLAFRGGACALLLAGACTGAIDSNRTNPPPPGTHPGPPGGMTVTGGPPGPNDPGPAPANAGRLRLLTRAQLENSLHDLLGDIPVAETEADTIASGFAS